MMESGQTAANLLHLAQIASTAPAAFLVASIWQGILLTALAWLGLEALPKTILGKTWDLSPRMRFLLWMSVFLLSSVLPFTAFLRTGHPAGVAHALVPAAHLSAIWAVILSSLWALASLASLSRLLLSALRLHRIVRTATPVACESLTLEMQAMLAGAGSGGRPVALALSESVDSPMVIGFFGRTIVLPAWLWSKLDAAELLQVVLHETAHLKRGDDWTNLLQKTLRALFPLNPALCFAERRLCWEREMACDDAVLDRSVNPRAYALCLTNLAEKGLLNRLQALAPGAWRRRSELAERVHRILKSRSGLDPLRSRPAAVGLLAMLLCVGAALTRCPQLVTFTVANSTPYLVRQSELAAGIERVSLPLPMGSSFNRQTEAHLVDASLRMTIPVPALHAATRHSVQHRHIAASRTVHARTVHARTRQPRFVQAAFVIPSGRPGAALPSTQFVFTSYRAISGATYGVVYGIALPNDGIMTLPILPAQAGWIIVQL